MRGQDIRYTLEVDFLEAALGARKRVSMPGGSAATSANFWHDDVYLSSDATIDQDDSLLGSVQRTNALPAGESYTRSQTFTLPFELSGDYFVIVRTDAEDRKRMESVEWKEAEAEKTEAKVEVK